MRRREVEAYRDAELESVVEYPEVSVPTNTMFCIEVCPALGPYPRGSPKLLARFLHTLNGHAQAPWPLPFPQAASACIM